MRGVGTPIAPQATAVNLTVPPRHRLYKNRLYTSELPSATPRILTRFAREYTQVKLVIRSSPQVNYYGGT